METQHGSGDLVEKNCIRSGGEDAVCFTAGPAGAPFAAGVIHAWLAIDRLPPLVSCGISMGSIGAAAMRRVYQELDDNRAMSLEEKRWTWFRRYLNSVTHNPLQAIWESLPNPVDFSATTSPVMDGSVPETLRVESEEARRHYHILTKLGVWLARLPVKVSTVATIIVMTVRRKERYGFLTKHFVYAWNWSKAVLGVWWHIIFSPSFFYEGGYVTDQRRPGRRNLFGLIKWRPLFREIWWIAVTVAVAVPTLIVLLSVDLEHHTSWRGLICFLLVLVGATASAAVSVMLMTTLYSWLSRWHEASSAETKLIAWILRKLDIDKALLHSYEASRQIYDLFIDRAPASAQKATEKDVRLLVVCAALERTQQVCLRHEMRVLDALLAATAVPGLFKPQTMRQDAVYESREYPISESEALNVIDGAAVRTNPIPAFFEWCKRSDSQSLVERLERCSQERPSLHVVYNVPLGYEGSLQSALIDAPDIVESALGGLQLEKRRDTRQEIRQMNYTSELELIRRKVTKQHGTPERGPFVILADEVAPRKDIHVRNDLEPRPQELMSVVAEGCKSTLETLYRTQIEELGKGQPVECGSLLSKYGGRRIESCGPSVSGLPEICERCSKMLNYKPPRKRDDVPDGLYRTFGARGSVQEHLSTEFNHLNRSGNIVFLASGGVFRGSFHIGVIAALTAANLYPDLVIGASVGTLVGGALCHITASSQAYESETLEKLTALFLRVDSDVALTRTLKSAAKQLGIRARSIRLSPSSLARMVRKGSKSNAGYAATGAPPALLDAISYLFAIPHRTTIRIASEFVAGHVTESVQAFLKAVRRETLKSFEIRSYLMGTSLLEARVRELLGEGHPGVNLNTIQPYHQPVRKKVSFFGTSSFLNAGVSLLLGRDFLVKNPSWDATFMGLSSSAFPAVFAPRTEAELLPGVGRHDRYFADGGLFDNLPFFPAIEVLAAVQDSNQASDSKSIKQLLQERVRKPNLFISAGLNAVAKEGGTYSNIRQISERASTLGFKSKTDSFSLGTAKTTKALEEVSQKELSCLDPSELQFLKTSVTVETLSIWPSSKKHLNGTFSFCRSLGMKERRIQRSIADGCFRTLLSITSQKATSDYIRSKYSNTGIRRTTRKEPVNPKDCPFFLRGEKPFQCPFAKSAKKAVSQIRDVCDDDKMHV